MYISRQINKENVTYLRNGILFSYKENEIMAFGGKWMEFEIITLSKVT